MTPEQMILVASRTLDNADVAYRAARRAGLGYATALALIEKESGGRNIYGHDAGGALSTSAGSVTVCGRTYPRGSDIEVTPANAAVFLMKVAAGERSNGMGPCQITYAGRLPDGRVGGYFRQMIEGNLLPWEPFDNMTFGFGLLKANYNRHGTWAMAGAVYNGGGTPNASALAYGRDLADRRHQWRAVFR